MKPLDRIHAEARARGRHIILPEGGDPRVAEAARRITEQGLARITLMDGPAIPGVTALTPAEAPDLLELADRWQRMRAARGMTADRALAEMRDPIRQAAMRVHLGQADGTVGGADQRKRLAQPAKARVLGRARRREGQQRHPRLFGQKLPAARGGRQRDRRKLARVGLDHQAAVGKDHAALDRRP